MSDFSNANDTKIYIRRVKVDVVQVVCPTRWEKLIDLIEEKTVNLTFE